MNRGKENPVCEACRLSSVDVEIPAAPNDPIQPYRLCQTCANRLENLALRPSEWFNLAAIHGPWKYHLHDDFYDEDGKADQAGIIVERAVEFPIPSVSEIEDDIEKLVDMAMTRWFFGHKETPGLVHALGQHDKGVLLSVLQIRAREIPNPYIESRAYEIAELVLHSFAADWIRDCSESHSEESFVSWACAAASCLPFEEGFSRVTAKLAMMRHKEPTLTCGALANFRSSRTLDWMESNIHEPITETWGRLTALSQFSWSRAKSWLNGGRPLSLVALDALNYCWHYDTVQLRKIRPKLLSPASNGEMTDELRAYERRDSKPRTERAVKLAIQNLDEIVGKSSA